MRIPGTRARGVAGIGVAIAIASVAGWVLLALVGRLLTPAEFALFVAFWGVLFGIGGSLSTVEQELARHASTGSSPDQPSVGAVTATAALFAGVAGAVTMIPALAERLYGSSGSGAGIVVLVAAVGFAVQFATRGRLVGSGATRDYAGIVVAEAAIRLVLLMALWWAGRTNLTGMALAVAAGSFAWLLWFGQARAVLAATAHHTGGWLRAARRSGSLMLGAALTSAVITGFPSMVTALTGNPPGAAGGAVFAALTISRVPLLLVSPIQAVAVPTVVRWQQDPHAGASRLHRALLAGALGAVGVGLIGALLGYLLGPWAVRLVYGHAYDVPALAVALLVLSAFLLAFVLLMSAALIAVAAHRQMILMWLVAASVTAAWLILSPLDVVATTATGSLAGPVAAIAYGLPTLWSRTSRRHASPPTERAEV